MRLCLALLSLAAMLCLAGVAARAEVTVSAGAYRVSVRTEPSVVPVGRAEVLVRVADASGQPVEGARLRVLAKMPEMDRGEREMPAVPVDGQPGLYRAPASFAMEGRYEVLVTIEGPAGSAATTVTLRTGEETALPEGHTSTGLGYVPWAVGILLASFVLYRMWRTGRIPKWRSITRPEAVAGIVLITLAVAGSSWAVRAYRRPNSMALIDALASDMSSMPAPPGQGPVELAVVERAPVEASIRYTGSAVGYVEQDVYPRVTGWITWMPFYAGDAVRKGQLLAKLDTPEYRSRTGERRANRQMAEQMAEIARLEYAQGLAVAAQARADVRSKQGALEEARRMHARAQAMLKESRAGITEASSELRAMRAELTASLHEQSEAEAMLQSAQAMQPEAEAMLSAMQADQAYWTKEIARMKVLLENGAVSGEEYEREEAMAKVAGAKVRQAEAKLQAVKSDIRAVRSRVGRAAAMAESAGAKITQAQSRVQRMEAQVEQAQAEIGALAGRVQVAEGDLDAARANVRAMEAGADAGGGKIRQAQAGVQSAQAALTTASVIQGYTEIRSLVDGVVTQRLISPGVLVNPGQAILKVAQINPIRLQANVAEADLARVRVGNPITMRAQDGRILAKARVTSITPAVDPVARTAVVEALAPNADHRFLPGQYVRMEITTDRRPDALRAPSSAIRWQSARSSRTLSTRQTAYVWVTEPAEGEAFTVRRASVQTGATDGRYTEILSGLEEGQQVVTRGHGALREGDAVAAVSWGDGGPEALPPATPKPGAPAGHGNHSGGISPGPGPRADERRPDGGGAHGEH